MCETFAGFPFLGSAGVLGTGIWDLGRGVQDCAARLRASDIDRNVTIRGTDVIDREG